MFEAPANVPELLYCMFPSDHPGFQPQPVLDIVKFGYVQVIVIPVHSVNEITWSGLVFVTLKFG